METKYDMKKKYITKDVNELCNVSRKQLRYYEIRGLLDHVSRNSENNYRYYTVYDILEILSIKEFKRIGFSIEAIQKMFKDYSLNNITDSVEKRIENTKEELNKNLHCYEQLTKRFLQLKEAIVLLNEM